MKRRLMLIFTCLACGGAFASQAESGFDEMRAAPAALSTPVALNDGPDRPELPQPSVDYSPQDVVRIVIDALGRNDDPFPDAGIETTFGFASPSNRVNTGPLEKFTRMVKTFPYGVMVDHAGGEISETVMVGEDAYLLVRLSMHDGGEAAFAFRLSRQIDGHYAGMWMTDAVWPVTKPVENLPGI